MAFVDIRKGLEKVLKDQISGLRIYREHPGSAKLEYPCLIIGPVGDIEYLPVLQAGGFRPQLICFLRVWKMSITEASEQMEEYRWPNGANSIFAAVNTDHTLDGSVNHAYVMGTSRPEQDPDDLDRLWEWQSEIAIQLTHAVN